jgi:hypothetical protein
MSDEYPETIAYTQLADDPGETMRVGDAVDTVRMGDAGTGATVRMADPAASPDTTKAYVRFGPGVPMPRTPAPDRATALWRGEVGAADTVEDPALTWRRRTQRWLLPLTVLILVIAVLIYFLWARSSAGSLTVNGASVQVAAPSLGCGGTERLTAAIETNGGSGTIAYRWLRSDGTSSDQLSQQVTNGERQVTVELDWSFDGHGATNATATISILSPQAEKAAASFTYRCAQ